MMRIISQEEADRIKKEYWNRLIIESGLLSHFSKDELVSYIEKHNDLASGIHHAWEIFLWAKKEKNILVIDTSEDNIKLCQKIYDLDQNNKNNLFRLLVIKIFAGLNYNDLVPKFVILWKKGEIYLSGDMAYFLSTAHHMALDGGRLKDFLLGLMDTDMPRFHKEIMDERTVVYFSNILGIENISKLFDPGNLLFSKFEFSWDDDYLLYYALAKFFFSRKDWYNSFCLFMKLQIYNEVFKVTTDELHDFKSDAIFYKDILCGPPSVEDIEKSVYESSSNIDIKNLEKTFSSNRQILCLALE